MIDYSTFRSSLKRLEEQNGNHRQGNPALSDLDREGIAESVIQRFKTCYDCLWKVLKRYLTETLGVADTPNSPKPVFRLADALAALHEKKCLHGDVKPSIRPSLRVIGVRLQDVAGRGSRDCQPHRAVQLHAVDLKEQLRTCSGVSVGASSSMSDRTPTGQDGTTYTEFYVAGVPQ